MVYNLLIYSVGIVVFVCMYRAGKYQRMQKQIEEYDELIKQHFRKERELENLNELLKKEIYFLDNKIQKED